jgi:hypothetical protein
VKIFLSLKLGNAPDTVVHAYNQLLRRRKQDYEFMTSMGKISKTLSLKKNTCQWLTPIILATQEAGFRKIEVQSQPWANSSETLSRKYPTQNRAGGVAQVVEPLPSKLEALSSISSTENKI